PAPVESAPPSQLIGSCPSKRRLPPKFADGRWLFRILLKLVGVESSVWRTIMQWSLKQKGWRALLIKIALLTTLWLVVAFVFATEFYLSARGAPMKISWGVAAASAFRDWFPWILLSPVAVVLAGQFRFSRDRWRRNLIIH